MEDVHFFYLFFEIRRCLCFVQDGQKVAVAMESVLLVLQFVLFEEIAYLIACFG
jgi:hypothetical protein